MKIEINKETYAISIFDENGIQFIYQPEYPNGDKFDSEEEAREWAEASVNSFNQDFEFYAPAGKGLSPERKPTPEQIEQWRKEAEEQQNNSEIISE